MVKESTYNKPQKLPFIQKVIKKYLAQNKNIKNCLKSSNLTKYTTGQNNPEMDNALKQLGEFYFLPNFGNLGDGFIAACAYQYLEARQYPYQVYQRSTSWLYQQPFNFVYGGGGLWINLYQKAYRNIINIFKSPHLKKCVILPSSFNNCDDLFEVLDERFTVFCREENSYKYCKSMNSKANFCLADDLAVNCDINMFRQDLSDPGALNDFFYNENNFLYVYNAYKKLLKKSQNELSKIKDFKVGYFFRQDKERLIVNNPAQSGIDLSAFCSHQWTDSGFAFLATRIFLDFIGRFDIIVTDRLHIAIAAAKLGKKVLALDNSYGKIAAIYKHSLQNKFENIKLIDPENIESELANIGDFVSKKSFCCTLPQNLKDFITSYGSVRNKHGYEKLT